MTENVRKLAEFTANPPDPATPEYDKWREELDRRWNRLTDDERELVRKLDPRVQSSHSKGKKLVPAMWEALGISKGELKRSLTREEIGEDILAVATATASVLGAYIGVLAKNQDNREQRIREGFKMLRTVTAAQLNEIEGALINKFRKEN